ncbi:hypothetical protein D9M71_542990 [compost metagenome]
MDVKRHPQLGGRGEEWLEFRLVQEAAMSCAVDHRAFESQFRDASSQFFGSGLRIGHWQRGEPEEPAGIRLRGCRQLVVRPPGQFYGQRRG